MRARPTTVLAIVAALVVALALVAAIVSNGRERPQLDASTPEGVVQLYVSTLFHGDVAGAVKYLDSELGCADPVPEAYLSDLSWVSAMKSTMKDDTAEVELRVEEGSGLDGTWSHIEVFTLRRDSDTWLITGEPWPLYSCK
ncbi:hypothetical protein [Tessaracoccus sp.]